MVALSGRGWTLAPCLAAMTREADRIAPKRSRLADGSIGDLAHASRTSDHNPSLGYVTALDLTHDPAGGFDAHARARLVVARHDARVKYVISNRQVARSYWSTVSSSNRAVDRSQEVGGRIPPWVWAHYTGTNPHTHHAHWSVLNTSAARDDLSPWWPSTPPPRPATPEEDEMTPELQQVLDRLEMRLVAVQETTARLEMRTIAVQNVTAQLSAGEVDVAAAAAAIADSLDEDLAKAVADELAGRLGA